MTVVHGGKRYRDRDLDIEAHLMNIAAQAAGHVTADDWGNLTGDDGGLSAFADARAMPGGVRADFDPDRETFEELADARNYLVWGIERDYAAFLRGESEATARYERRMRALRALVVAWWELRTPAA
jgi:hypothetical protein